eukprot:Stramenopile-MAST_4_protein_1795
MEDGEIPEKKFRGRNRYTKSIEGVKKDAWVGNLDASGRQGGRAVSAGVHQTPTYHGTPAGGSYASVNRSSQVGRHGSGSRRGRGSGGPNSKTTDSGRMSSSITRKRPLDVSTAGLPSTGGGDLSSTKKRRKRSRKPTSRSFRQAKAKTFHRRQRLNSEGGEQDYAKFSRAPSAFHSSSNARRSGPAGRRWVSRSPPRRLYRPRRRSKKTGKTSGSAGPGADVVGELNGGERTAGAGIARSRRRRRRGPRRRAHIDDAKTEDESNLPKLAPLNVPHGSSFPFRPSQEVCVTPKQHGASLTRLGSLPGCAPMGPSAELLAADAASMGLWSLEQPPPTSTLEAAAPVPVQATTVLPHEHGAESLPPYTEPVFSHAQIAVTPAAPVQGTYAIGSKGYPRKDLAEPEEGPPEDEYGTSGDEGADSGEEFVGEEGGKIGPAFTIVCVLGNGTFGRVLECTNANPGNPACPATSVAIKVIRRVERYSKSAKIEAEIVKKLNAREEAERPGANPFVVKLYDTFDFQKHVCLVFETCGPDLYYFMKRNRRRGVYGFKPKHLQFIVFQLVSAIGFLHDKCGCVHTDLKLENILFVSDEYFEFPENDDMVRLVPKTLQIKLIDFGSSAFETDYHSSIINTRQYRAPEVVLGHAWSYPSDVWGIGCMAMELMTGQLLFQTHDSFEHLALMEKLCGRFSESMIAGNKEAIKRGTGRNEVHDFFAPDEANNSEHRLRYPIKERHDEESTRHVGMQKSLLEQCVDAFKKDDAEAEMFASLCSGILTLDPRERPRAVDLAQYPYFAELRQLGHSELEKLAFSLPLTESGVYDEYSDWEDYKSE